MGILDSSFLDLIDKATSWISWRTSELTSLNSEFKMVGSDRNTCSECHLDFKHCKFCWEINFRNERNRRFSDKIYPSDSPRQSPEPPSPCFSGEKSDGCSPIRSDGDTENSSRTFFSQPSEYFHDISDVDSSSTSARHIFHSFTSDKEPEDPEYSDDCPNNLSLFRDECEKAQKPLDFENNGLLWFPPPPEDDMENNYFAYDDEDDEIGDSGVIFSSSSSLVSLFPSKKKPDEELVQGHFRALVAQLLQGEDIKFGKQNWLDIVTDIAWKAANLVRPDTSRGGSMDPGDYVKVKCIASGNSNESTLVKGVICTKNVKHKRMTSQYKNPRLLLLGGSLEYQKIPNQLSSFQTLLQQEIDHLKLIVSKIEAHRPNVLLVEKSVSSYAQEFLLEKDISLVLNVKRPLLERIARCTGANITPSVDSFSTTCLGHCDLFRLEKISEDFEKKKNQFNKKPSKTLMFFEGCPRRLGCTVLLRGACRDELKKVKRVVQFAVFAAYHLSLETSFLADEGATLPNKIKMNPSFSLENDLVKQKLTPEHLPECQLGCNDISSSYAVSDIGGVAQQQQDLSADGERELRERETLTAAADGHPSLLVSFSSRCVLNGTVCERSRLIRITFYGCFDKPLGRYLQDDLFHQTSSCGSCKEPAEAHVYCFSHQEGNLTINVRRLPCSVKQLPGEKDGKIWMWHRCLKCPRGVDGVPPSSRLVLMSDAAWGLSFGKYLELSFSNNATANRVASCGHSLQKDCLRYYGFGSVVAFFRYSPIDILSVHLPPPVLDFSCNLQQEWIRKEAAKLLRTMEALYAELFNVLDSIDQKSMPSEVDFCELHDHIMDLKDKLVKESSDYTDLLQTSVDILELNRLRRSLFIGSHVWDRRFYSLDSLAKTRSISSKSTHDLVPSTELNKSSSSNSCYQDSIIYHSNSLSSYHDYNNLEDLESDLSDKIDSAWTGTDYINNPETDSPNIAPIIRQKEDPALRRLRSPARVYSFDSALRLQDRIKKGLVRNPISNVQRCYSQISPRQTPHKLSIKSSFISSASSILCEGACFPQTGENDLVIAVYDNEPTSIVAYALSTKVYQNLIADMPSKNEGVSQSFGSLDLDDYTHYGSYGSSSVNSLFVEPEKNSPHLKIDFEDACGGEKVKFSCICYFAKEFEALRKKCSPNKLDFIRSLSRCKGWSAQGGKSNVYFAKSLDDRFIIKQVQKTELESFQEFAPDYFKYLTESLSTRSPTSLAKVLGIYQVTVKHLKGSKETKIDLMVMENIFFGRSISRIYDLKGSARSRYNADPSGTNKVLLDTNLLETMRTKPIFLGSKAKRSLERAVWNDTSFLTSVDVMDYSLLVGVDHERNELVLGIIDYMRQYTWDKHLETWVKASLGGPKYASPTIVSPKQYKKRFRKAMTTYFLTVPDQWSS